MSTIKPLSVSAKRLAQTISGSATSFKLDNIFSWDGVTNLTSADFGTKAYASFRNSAGTLIEFMEIDPATIASSSISILRRGLKYNGDDLTTEVAGNKLTWVRGDTIVELGTHLPQLLAHYVDIVGAQTIAGVKTFSSLPATTAGDPVGNNDLARKSYVDTVVLGTLTTINVIVPGTAGATISDGNLVYFDETDNEWKLTDADTAATVNNVLLGIAQGAGTDGVAITNGVLLQGVDDAQSGLVQGDVQYASNTAGGISSSAGTTEVTVGIAKSTTELYFNPRFNQQITEDQQDALAGNNGTPSNSNKYITQTGLQIGAEIYAADAGANDTYVITLSPAPAAYVTGMVVNFKANTVNTGAATLNVNSLGAKTIKKAHDQDLSDGDIESGQIVTVIYDGTNFQMQSQPGALATADIQEFASSGTWTKPGGAKKVYVECWGGGASGGVGINNAGGGGGGEYRDGWFDASDLGSTVTVTIGDGGAARSGSTTSGASGGNTTFGSHLLASGGSGGGQNGAVSVAGGAAGSPGGSVSGLWGDGVSAAVGQYGFYSGGGGGSDNSGTAKAGGSSYWGGAGGGGAKDGGSGSVGAGGTSTHGGNGGSGGGVDGGAAAVAGSVPGGGGGGACNEGNSVTSGAGGKGQMRVTTFF